MFKLWCLYSFLDGESGTVSPSHTFSTAGPDPMEKGKRTLKSVAGYIV